jgi:cytoskeletal protein RodZ
MKLPFRRQAVEEPQVPAEIQEYYEAERRERAGVAWLLALGTLVVTLILALGLFFGGRWAYRKVAHRNNKATVATTQSKSSNTQNNTGQNNSANTSQNNSTATTTPPSATTPTTSQPNSNSSSNSSASTSSPAPSSSSAASPTAPATSNSAQGKTPLTNTGPGDVVATFLGVSAVAYISHAAWTRRKHSSL